MEDDADDLEQEMDPMDLLKVRSTAAVAPLVAFKIGRAREALGEVRSLMRARARTTARGIGADAGRSCRAEAPLTRRAVPQSRLLWMMASRFAGGGAWLGSHASHRSCNRRRSFEHVHQRSVVQHFQFGVG